MRRTTTVLLAGIAIAVSLAVPANPSLESHEKDRLAAVQTLLDERALALRMRDREAFLAGVDPAAPEFRQAQSALFDSLAPLSFGRWQYEVLGGEWTADPRTIDTRKHRGEVWLPYVRLLYRLHGFDTGPVARALDYTFVRRGSRWYLASDTDLDQAGKPRPRRDPWDFGPITVRRTKHALVIAHDDKAADMVAKAADEAVGNVTTIWGDDWSQTAVVVVPRDENEHRSLIVRDSDEEVAHVQATAARVYNYVPEIEEPPSDAAPVGSRIVIAPSAIEHDLVDGRLLSHEFLHIATAEHTPGPMPMWLFEGLPEWAAQYNLPPFPRAARVASRLRRSGPPAELPHTFHKDPADRGDDYVLSELLCRWIVERYGRARLVQLYRTLGKELREVADAALVRPRTDAVMRRVLGVSESQVLREWQRYLRFHLRDFDGLFASFPGFETVKGDDGVVRGASRTERDNVFVPMESRLWRASGGRTIVVSVFDTGTSDPVAKREPVGTQSKPSVPGIPGSSVSSGKVVTFFGEYDGTTVILRAGRFTVQATFVGPIPPPDVHALARLQHATVNAALGSPQP